VGCVFSSRLSSRKEMIPGSTVTSDKDSGSRQGRRTHSRRSRPCTVALRSSEHAHPGGYEEADPFIYLPAPTRVCQPIVAQSLNRIESHLSLSLVSTATGDGRSALALSTRRFLISHRYRLSAFFLPLPPFGLEPQSKIDHAMYHDLAKRP
jgi:hypothetical protein